MGYSNQLVEQKGSTQPNIGALEDSINRLVDIDKYQKDLILRIEDKLHMIINLRTPQDPAKLANEVPVPDQIRKFNTALDSIASNNTWLSDVIVHLNQII